jgi:hypothetical protein
VPPEEAKIRLQAAQAQLRASIAEMNEEIKRRQDASQNICPELS